MIKRSCTTQNNSVDDDIMAGTLLESNFKNLSSIPLMNESRNLFPDHEPVSNHDSWTALDHCISWGSPHSCNPHKRCCMNDAFFFTFVKYTLSSIKTICDD
ncbi:unnamed protein product [Porites lobata]|uniref:Uncharacterized protein n=1 Tax=Porites lobata TaxID=104759 RepID=A0ABN8RIS4_9CNID|nr:unnamed protein product [Porites lobata]